MMNGSRMVVSGGLRRASPARLLHVDPTVYAARRPLIQFPKRSGKPLSYNPTRSSAASQSCDRVSAMPVLIGTDQNITVPLRFQRRPITDEECYVINNGGSYGDAQQTPIGKS